MHVECPALRCTDHQTCNKNRLSRRVRPVTHTICSELAGEGQLGPSLSSAATTLCLDSHHGHQHSLQARLPHSLHLQEGAGPAAYSARRERLAGWAQKTNGKGNHLLWFKCAPQISRMCLPCSSVERRDTGHRICERIHTLVD